MAASIQNTSWVRMKSRRSSAEFSEPKSSSMMAAIPGPPSLSYFKPGATDQLVGGAAAHLEHVAKMKNFDHG